MAMNRKDRRAEAARQRHAKAMVGMDLRYGGRTLIVTAFVNTRETPEEIVRRVQPAARGPKDVMAIVMSGVLDKDKADPIWAAQDIPTLFDGRTVIVEVYANTDEAPGAISARVMMAANKPVDPKLLEECSGQLAVVTTVSDAPEEETRAMWKRFFKMLEEKKDGPN